ncbi:MAG: hypothetical protein AABO58_23235 [Acidobacteriota bacterium]
MKELRTVLLAVILAACATSPPSTAPPVHVVVSADEDVRLMVNTEKLKEVTEAALRKYASEAGEATVTIRFNSLGVAKELTPGLTIMSMPYPGQNVPIVSSQPWNEPSQPTVGARNTVFMPTRTRTEHPVVKGTYTITDASGTVLEQKSIAIPPDDRDGYSDRMDAQRALAADVAKRVAALRKR